MTRRFLSLVLITCSMLSSTVFAGVEASFKQSKAIWEQIKTNPNLEYQFSTEYESWIGLGQTTSISVRGSTVVGRSFERWRWYYDYNDNNSYKRETEYSWIEDSNDIGSHEEGETAKNLDQVYNQCESNVLSLDAEENTIEFKVDEKGLIKTCRARSIYCADDCWEGVDIVKLQFSTGTKAVEGCQQNGEEISCSFHTGNCNYVASVAAMFIDHCGHRNEKIILRETQQQVFCPILYQYSSGIFLSHEDWVVNTSCSTK